MSDAVQKSGEILSLERALARVESELGDSYVRHHEDLQRLRAFTADLKAERDLREQVNHLAVEALQRADAAEKRCAELEARAERDGDQQQAFVTFANEQLWAALLEHNRLLLAVAEMIAAHHKRPAHDGVIANLKCVLDAKGSAEAALTTALADAEMAEHAHDACEEQLTAATARAEASDARAQAAEKRCGEIEAKLRLTALGHDQCLELLREAALGLDHCAAALGIGEWDPHDALNAIMQLRDALAAAKLGG